MPGKFFRYQYAEGDIVTMKKQHPCGSKQWEVLSAESDIRFKCCGCGHIAALSRAAAEKATVAVKPSEPKGSSAE